MPATDPVQAVAEALIAHTLLSDDGRCSCGHVVPLGHSFAAHQGVAAVAAARPAIEREAKAVAVESLREFARAQDTWCDAGRAEQVITRRAMRDALLREAHRIEADQ